MRKLLTPKDNGILGVEGGHSTCFMKTNVGVRASKTRIPTREDLGLRWFDLKPPSWCLVQFPKNGSSPFRERHWKKLQQKYLVWKSSKEEGDRVVLF